MRHRIRIKEQNFAYTFDTDMLDDLDKVYSDFYILNLIQIEQVDLSVLKEF